MKSIITKECNPVLRDKEQSEITRTQQRMWNNQNNTYKEKKIYEQLDLHLNIYQVHRLG